MDKGSQSSPFYRETALMYHGEVSDMTLPRGRRAVFSNNDTMRGYQRWLISQHYTVSNTYRKGHSYFVEFLVG